MKKLNLIPVWQLKQTLVEKNPYNAVYSPKNGQLRFSKDYALDKGLQNKFLKVMIDSEKKIVAWMQAEGGELNNLKGLKQVKQYGGTWCVFLPKKEINQTMNLDITKKYKQRPILTEKRAIFNHDVDYIKVIPVEVKAE